MEGTSFLFETAPSLAADGLEEIRLSSGTTIRLKKKKIASSHDDIASDQPLLNMDRLFARVEYQRTIQESRRALRVAKDATGNSKNNGRGRRDGSEQNSNTIHALWTEKYRPSSFIQLCSSGNDRLYRQILHWLKKWSSIVLGEPNIEPPERKILLIYGPSGTGKTIATNLLLLQLGYEPFEINAANSMDLGPTGVSSLKERIVNALTSNLLTSNGRPTCLLLDEIDSSANASEIVRILVNLVARKPINRPIVCIANDRFNGVLEKLRPHCEYVAFNRPNPTVGSAQRSIKEFLQKINLSEKIGLDSKSISDVVEICDADLRACINYLQFNRPLTSLTPTESSTSSSFSSSALKDTKLTWFATVDRIFKRDSLVLKEEAYAALSEVIENAGRSRQSMEKVIMGVFTRYLDAVHLHDDSLMKPNMLSDWLAFYDCTGPEMETAALAVCMKAWSLFSEIRTKYAKEPLIDRNKNKQSNDALKENISIISRVKDQIPPELAVCGVGECLSTVTIPYIDQMINVGTTKDQNFDSKNIIKVADIVKQLNLHLETHRDLETNRVTLVYAPEWESITQFSSSQAPTNLVSLQKKLQVRRNWLFPLVSAHLEKNLRNKKRKAESDLDSIPSNGRASTPTSVAQNGPISKKPNKNDDFFKQYSDLALQVDSHNEKQVESRTWVKYHEGFSNAVRKNIGWKDFFASTNST